MLTVHPAIMIGAYTLDEDRLPRDEFDIRRAELDRAMDEAGLAALLIHGDAREHKALAYYTNFMPRLRWAMALVPRRGETRLLASMSARDMPALRQMTWIGDVRSGWDWEGGFDPWLAGLGASAPAAIGTLGFDTIEGRLFRAVERSLGDRFVLHDATLALPGKGVLRPRELALMREACALVRSAGSAALESWRGGSGSEAALLAGERAARAQGALDVRTLVSLDCGRSLTPFQGRFDGKTDPFAGYVVVKAGGFWAELFLGASAHRSPLKRRADAALAAALAAMGPGVAGATVHAEAMAALAGAPHPVLGASIGRRIGLSLNDGADITAASDVAFVPGSVYALHVGVVEPGAGAFASAMVAVTADGIEVLCRSDEDS